MRMRHRQEGMTLIGWLVLLGMLGFLTLIVLRLAPAYMEYSKVVTSVDSVYQQLTPESTPAQVRADITRRFNVNDVRTILGSDVALTRVDGNWTFHVQYEVRREMMGNVDVVVMFERVWGDPPR